MTWRLAGMVFSVVPVALQFGIYLGLENRVAAMLYHTRADLWVVPFGTKSVNHPSLLPGHEKHAMLSTPGVAGTEELAVGFVAWRKLSGGTIAALLAGSDRRNNGSLPRKVAEGSTTQLPSPNCFFVASTDVGELGTLKRANRSEVNRIQVAVQVVIKGIGFFTTLTCVSTSIALARQLLDATPDRDPYTAVCTVPGCTAQDVNPGAAPGQIVSVVIRAATLYLSTKDLKEFASLRALGASADFIRPVILTQAALSAVTGCGILLSLLVISSSHDSQVIMTIQAHLLLALTAGMCGFAAISAIFKVTRIDPAVVFSR